jgi:L-threonate 2-dehydrogenase
MQDPRPNAIRERRMNDTVGFVGLGQMGTPMSGHLLAAGFRVVGYDIDAARVRTLEDAGGQGCGSPAEVAAAADVVITSLPSPGALHATLGDAGGLLEGAGEHPLIVETSTLALADKEAAREAAEAAGATLLDCPLSGTAAQAHNKDLVVFASGDEAGVERCQPVFDGFSRATYRLGAFGNGSKMKYIANHLVAIHNVAAAEALVLAMKAGMDPQTVHEVISAGAGSSRMFEVRGPSMVEGDFDKPGMSVRVFQKDLGVIADFARSVACPTPLFTAGTQVYVAALAHGFGDQDAAAVCGALERLANHTRGD